MPHGRSLFPSALLAVLIVTSGRAISQHPSTTAPPLVSEAAEADAPASCPSGGPPARRVRVVIPPPEVVFRYAKKPGLGLFHHHESPAEPCTASPCPAPAAPAGGNGMVSFNLNMTIPYMMNAGGMATSPLGGAGLFPGMLGSQGSTGFGSGLGGLTGGLSNPALAAALGLPTSNGLSGNPSTLELLQLLQRAPAGSGAAAGAAAGGSVTPASLAQGVEELRASIQKLTASAGQGAEGLQARVQKLSGDIDAIEQGVRFDQAEQLKEFKKLMERVEKVERRLGATQPEESD